MKGKAHLGLVAANGLASGHAGVPLDGIGALSAGESNGMFLKELGNQCSKNEL